MPHAPFSCFVAGPCFCWQASHDRLFLLQEVQHHTVFSHIMLPSNTTSSSFFTYYVASQWCKNQHHPLFSHIMLLSSTRILQNATSYSIFTYYVAFQYYKILHHTFFSHIHVLFSYNFRTFCYTHAYSMFFLCFCLVGFGPGPPENYHHVYDVNFSHMLHFWLSGLPRLFLSS